MTLQYSLPFAVNDLEPVLSHQEVATHFLVHTQQYLTTLNELVAGTAFEARSLEDLAHNTSIKQSDAKLWHVVSQAYNHKLFWDGLKPHSADPIQPSTQVMAAIVHQFDTVDALLRAVVDESDRVFGSGWVWVCMSERGMYVTHTPNAIRPMDDATILWCVDVWEHAYLYDQKYVGDRKSYVSELVKLVNWKVVNARYEEYEKDHTDKDE